MSGPDPADKKRSLSFRACVSVLLLCALWLTPRLYMDGLFRLQTLCWRYWRMRLPAFYGVAGVILFDCAVAICAIVHARNTLKRGVGVIDEFLIRVGIGLGKVFIAGHALYALLIVFHVHFET